MQHSAALGLFQDRGPCMESLEVIGLWNLFRRRLAFYHQMNKKRQI